MSNKIQNELLGFVSGLLLGVSVLGVFYKFVLMPSQYLSKKFATQKNHRQFFSTQNYCHQEFFNTKNRRLNIFWGVPPIPPLVDSTVCSGAGDELSRSIFLFKIRVLSLRKNCVQVSTQVPGVKSIENIITAVRYGDFIPLELDFKDIPHPGVFFKSFKTLFKHDCIEVTRHLRCLISRSTSIQSWLR